MSIILTRTPFDLAAFTGSDPAWRLYTLPPVLGPRATGSCLRCPHCGGALTDCGEVVHDDGRYTYEQMVLLCYTCFVVWPTHYTRLSRPNAEIVAGVTRCALAWRDKTEREAA